MEMWESGRTRTSRSKIRENHVSKFLSISYTQSAGFMKISKEKKRGKIGNTSHSSAFSSAAIP